MSGVYNYHATIDNPVIHYPATDSQQAPFFFGGSQVPINLSPLSQIVGKGVYKNSNKGKEITSNIKSGRGVKTYIEPKENIIRPKILPRK